MFLGLLCLSMTTVQTLRNDSSGAVAFPHNGCGPPNKGLIHRGFVLRGKKISRIVLLCRVDGLRNSTKTVTNN